MAKKNEKSGVENGITMVDAEESGPSNRCKIKLSDATVASFSIAAEKFSAFGLDDRQAKRMVVAEIERLAAGVSAVALFAQEVARKYDEMKEAGVIAS